MTIEEAKQSINVANKKDAAKKVLSDRKNILAQNIKANIKVGDSTAELIEINKLLRS